MRIAIDLTLLPTQLVGVGSYAKNLIDSLAKYDKKNKYFIFIKHEHSNIFEINQNNVNIIYQKNILRNKILRVLWEQFILPLYIKRLNINLLHSIHYTVPLFARCKTIVTFHDMTFFIYPEKHIFLKRIFFRLFIRISSWKANRLIAVSESTKKDIIKFLGASNKIDVVYETVDSKYHPFKNESMTSMIRKKYSILNKFILYVGTLEPRKNIIRLIQAYHNLLTKKLINHQLVIVGKKGWHYQEIFNMVNKLGLNKGRQKMIFTGYVPEEELPFLYNAADVFIYPSLYEGFGIPPLEALACGVPVISSNVSSLPEVVGDAGILIDPYNVQEISQAMFEILKNHKKKEQFRIKGLKRAEKFSNKNMAEGTIKVYEKTMQEEKKIL
ncbi:MAG: glycosyltransferase family 1 protein [Candidatus Caldatribacteriota bacterium]